MKHGQTPSQTVGPFFHFALPLFEGPVLVTDKTKGERVTIEGRVLDGDGQPLKRRHDRNLAGERRGPLRPPGRQAGEAARSQFSRLRTVCDRQGRSLQLSDDPARSGAWTRQHITGAARQCDGVRARNAEAARDTDCTSRTKSRTPTIRSSVASPMTRAGRRSSLAGKTARPGRSCSTSCSRARARPYSSTSDPARFMSQAHGLSTTRTLLFLAAASFASAASLRACDPILPDIAAAFSTTPGDAAKVVTVFGVGYALAGFCYGFHRRPFRQASRHGGDHHPLEHRDDSVRAREFSRDADDSRASPSRLTAAAIIPLAFAWIGDVIPYERRQPVLGRFLSGQISGMVLGQVFAGIIAEHCGWRYVFVLIAALFVIAGVALAFEVRGQPAHPAHSPEPVDPDLKRFTSMLREPWVLIVLGTTFLEGMIFFGAYTFVGSYIWARFGLGLDLVGLIVAGFGVGGLIYAASAGRLFALLGECGLMLWGGILVAISFVVIAIAPMPAAVAPATILAGLSYYMIHNTLQTHATQMAPAARGLAVSTFASCLVSGSGDGRRARRAGLRRHRRQAVIPRRGRAASLSCASCSGRCSSRVRNSGLCTARERKACPKSVRIC